VLTVLLGLYTGPTYSGISLFSVCMFVMLLKTGFWCWWRGGVRLEGIGGKGVSGWDGV
jgi:hypothetical protein